MIEPMSGDIFQRGQVLNNTYEIEGVLGRGGTGEAYRARNLISDRIVAIKALNSRFSGNDDYIGLMRREEQMRDILNDAVVRYTECSRSDQGHVFLVMDFIDGPSLNDIMQQRRLDPRELLIVAHRIAEGLTAAHGRGIVHRDLSPDNVILRGANPEQATIIDFGIAKDTAAGARTIVGNDFAGKYEYAAPEQLEGKAEARSDLYSLGALLLAAFRGQVPFAGATPGEMVRRKQSALDTGGVPEPLKGLIDRLTAPNPADRPQSAEALLGLLDRMLKPTSQRGRAAAPTPDPEGPGRRRVLWVAVPLVLAGGVGGAWYGGLFDRFLTQPLPVASPFRFEARAARGDEPAALGGNAPSADDAVRLTAAFNDAARAAVSPETLAPAQGAPVETWTEAATAALDATEGLEDWSVSLSDRTARVTGLAPDNTVRAAAEGRLKDWASRYGFDLTPVLQTGPRDLMAGLVTEALAGVADCGPLLPDRPAGASYSLGERITVTGDIAAPDTVNKVRTRLAGIAGDRTVAVETTVLNADICTVRQVLPVLPPGNLSIWLGDGPTGAANLSGVFHVNENPIVDVLVPASVTGAKLWVVVVDNTGKVFNLIPNINFDEQALDALGVVENGVRRVRVLFSAAEFAQDRRRLAMKISPTDFGKSEFIAILSRDNLFDIRRPRDESVASFAEALAAIRSERPENIIGVATRLLDSRP